MLRIERYRQLLCEAWTGGEARKSWRRFLPSSMKCQRKLRWQTRWSFSMNYRDADVIAINLRRERIDLSGAPQLAATPFDGRLIARTVRKATCR